MEIRNSKSEILNKSEKLNSKFKMDPNSKTKRYDLEDRTLLFALNVRSFVKKLKKTIGNLEDSRQLIRASGSVGANYIEANESLGKKDFAMRIRICRKEAKESAYWLKLVDTGEQTELNTQRVALIQEATELTSIFGAILKKCV
jgi:four helix bundle protein